MSFGSAGWEQVLGEQAIALWDRRPDIGSELDALASLIPFEEMPEEHYPPLAYDEGDECWMSVIEPGDIELGNWLEEARRLGLLTYEEVNYLLGVLQDYLLILEVVVLEVEE